MIIGIDGNEANVEKKVGVSVYTMNLLTYFQKTATKDTQFRIYLRLPPRHDLPQENEYFRYTVVPGKFMWSQLFLPLHLNFFRKIDVFFSPAHYAPRYCPVPIVTTIHDLAYYYYPQEFLKKDLYKLQNWTKYSIERSKKVIAVSKTTKKDILKFYNTPDEKIEVIYNGFEKKSSEDGKEVWEKISAEYHLSSHSYILYLGTLQPRKNIPTLIKAFKSFRETYKDFKLVLVGRKGWLYNEIFEEVKKFDLTDSITFTGFIPDEEAISLYKHAFCFVLPSLYEGFGIPILEAMSFDCPVITSYASSLPEVGGEACLYFEPENADDLVFNLKLLKEDSSLRKELIQKGRERVKEFSWEKCAQETLRVIQTST